MAELDRFKSHDPLGLERNRRRRYYRCMRNDGLQDGLQVVLAEKPSTARELASFLGARARREGYYEGGGYKVTWALGHLVALKCHSVRPCATLWHNSRHSRRLRANYADYSPGRPQ